MRIIAVDDEETALARLCDCIGRAKPEVIIDSFLNPMDALDFVSENPVDVAFLDIEMGQVDGIQLARKMKTLLPRINIVFVTGYDEYSTDAFSLYASGYVMKPYSVKDIARELENLRFPLAEEKEEQMPQKEITVQCFGHFKARRNGRPIGFKYSKTTELLAYLINCKGAMCSSKEIIAALFEDDNKEAYYQKLRADLMDNLPPDLIITRRGYIGVNAEKIFCDYYDYLNGKPAARAAFTGEYMTQYEWADEHFSWKENIKIK